MIDAMELPIKRRKKMVENIPMEPSAGCGVGDAAAFVSSAIFFRHGDDEHFFITVTCHPSAARHIMPYESNNNDLLSHDNVGISRKGSSVHVQTFRERKACSTII